MKHKSSIEKIPVSDAEVMHYDAHPSAEEMAEAIASAKLAPLSRPLLKLYCFCAVAFLCSTMNGILPPSPPSLHLHDKDRTKN